MVSIRDVLGLYVLVCTLLLVDKIYPVFATTCSSPIDVTLGGYDSCFCADDEDWQLSRDTSIDDTAAAEVSFQCAKLGDTNSIWDKIPCRSLVTIWFGLGMVDDDDVDGDSSTCSSTTTIDDDDNSCDDCGKFEFYTETNDKDEFRTPTGCSADGLVHCQQYQVSTYDCYSNRCKGDAPGDDDDDSLEDDWPQQCSTNPSGSVAALWANQAYVHRLDDDNDGTFADDEGDDNDYQCYLNFFNYNSKDSARAKIHYIVQSQDPPPNFCNGHGTASLAYQSCDPGTGVGCDDDETTSSTKFFPCDMYYDRSITTPETQTCISGGTDPTSLWKCTCTEGTNYGGTYCNECLEACLNGVCNTSESSAVCDCFPGWTGDTCDSFRCGSSNNLCQYGTCVLNNTCSCAPNYSGPACNQCDLCENGGACVGELGQNTTAPVCNCEGTGFTGDTCEDPLPTLLSDLNSALCSLSANDTDQAQSSAESCCVTLNSTTNTTTNNAIVQACCFLESQLAGSMIMQDLTSQYISNTDFCIILAADLEPAVQNWVTAGKNLVQFTKDINDLNATLTNTANVLGFVNQQEEQLEAVVSFLKSIRGALTAAINNQEEEISELTTLLQSVIIDVATNVSVQAQNIHSDVQASDLVSVAGDLVVSLLMPNPKSVVDTIEDTIGLVADGVNAYAATSAEQQQLEDEVTVMLLLFNDTRNIANIQAVLTDPNSTLQDILPALYLYNVAIETLQAWTAVVEELVIPNLQANGDSEAATALTISFTAYLNANLQQVALIKDWFRVALQEQQFEKQQQLASAISNRLTSTLADEAKRYESAQIGAATAQLQYALQGLITIKYFYEEARQYNYWALTNPPYVPQFGPCDITGNSLLECNGPSPCQVVGEQCQLCADLQASFSSSGNTQTAPGGCESGWFQFTLRDDEYSSEFGKLQSADSNDPASFNVLIQPPNQTVYTEGAIKSLYSAPNLVIPNNDLDSAFISSNTFTGSVPSTVQMFLNKGNSSSFQYSNCDKDTFAACSVTYYHQAISYAQTVRVQAPASPESTEITLFSFTNLSPYGWWEVGISGNQGISYADVKNITIFFYLDFCLEDTELTSAFFYGNQPVPGNTGAPGESNDVSTESQQYCPNTNTGEACTLHLQGAQCSPSSSSSVVSNDQLPDGRTIHTNAKIDPFSSSTGGTLSAAWEGFEDGGTPRLELSIPGGTLAASSVMLALDGGAGYSCCNTITQMADTDAVSVRSPFGFDSTQLGFYLAALQDAHTFAASPTGNVTIRLYPGDYYLARAPALRLYYWTDRWRRALMISDGSDDRKRDDDDTTYLTFTAPTVNTHFHLFMAHVWTRLADNVPVPSPTPPPPPGSPPSPSLPSVPTEFSSPPSSSSSDGSQLGSLALQLVIVYLVLGLAVTL